MLQIGKIYGEQQFEKRLTPWYICRRNMRFGKKFYYAFTGGKKSKIFNFNHIKGVSTAMVLAESNSKKIITKPQKQEFRFASLFGSGAVFQRDTPLPVWGKAAPFCKIRCSIDNSSAVTISDDEGNFKLSLPPQKAGTGKTLIAEEIASGRKIISENIAVGEVYLASGQSNIEFQLKKSLSRTDDKPSADDPDFRFFQVPMTAYPFRKNDVEGKWERKRWKGEERGKDKGVY